MIIRDYIEEGVLYKKMYLHLFNRVTDAVENSDVSEIKDILMKAQCETEEIFMDKKLDEEWENEIEKILKSV